MRPVQDSKSLFRSQLEKAAKSLIKKYDHISKLIEEIRNQYTFGQSRARLDTLRQFHNAKLVDKEVVAKILRLAGYFSNAEDDENKGRLDKVIEAVTRQANGEKATANESQKKAKETTDKEAEKKDE